MCPLFSKEKMFVHVFRKVFFALFVSDNVLVFLDFTSQYDSIH